MSTEVALYDRNGKPEAYIAGDGSTIYLWDGKPVSYVDRNCIYHWEGQHIGWFVEGIVYDIGGYRVGSIGAHCPVVKQIPPIRASSTSVPSRESGM